MHSTQFQGVNRDQLRAAVAAGVDHGGNPIEPFVDVDGGWTMRCCLTDSLPGDRVAIIAWSPFPWNGAYAETGPIAVHVDPCPEAADLGRLPDDFDARPMTLRPYTHDHKILYSAVEHIAEGAGISTIVDELLARDDVAEVIGRNVTGGCYAFRAVRNT